MTRKRRVLIAAVAAAALLLAWWLRRDAADTPTASAASAPPAAATAPAADTAPKRYRSAREVRAVVADAKAPVIDGVELEKSEVCDGEENLVTVKAHAPDPEDDAFLHYMVAGSTGRSVVVRGSSDPGAAAHAEVIAFGRNGVSTSVPLPRFTVKPCKAPHKLLLSYRMMPNSHRSTPISTAPASQANPGPNWTRSVRGSL